jgi:hypothetical protein
MASQPVIDYLQCLGVTTVLLLTVRHSTTENTLACCWPVWESPRAGRSP